MEKTNVKVEFNVIGEEFQPENITEKLLINPTSSWKKGEKVRNRNIERQESCWTIGTEYEESLDINNQLKEIIHLIKDKKDELVELKKIYGIDYMFEVIINIENNEKPAIYLNSEAIEFAHYIDAEFDFDLYLY